MNILVIGGNGFIGSHLVDALVCLGYGVTVLDQFKRRYGQPPRGVRFIHGDFKQELVMREALVNIDIVYHLAWSTIHEVSNRDLAADIYANLLPSIKLMDLCIQSSVKRVVLVSSGGAVYGSALNLPIDEAHPTNPLSGYGVTKLAVEKYLQLYGLLHGLDYVIFRPSVPYGPRQSPFGRQGAVAVFLYRVASGLPVSIVGDGSVIRDYFYVNDLTKALCQGAEATLHDSRIFNIGGMQGYSLLDLIGAVEDIVGKRALIEWLPSRAFDPPAIVLDTTLAQHMLSWHTDVSLVEGLALTWQWMAEEFQLGR